MNERVIHKWKPKLRPVETIGKQQWLLVLGEITLLMDAEYLQELHDLTAEVCQGCACFRYGRETAGQ